MNADNLKSTLERTQIPSENLLPSSNIVAAYSEMRSRVIKLLGEV